MIIKLALVDDKPIVRKVIRDKLSAFENIKIISESSEGEDFLKTLKLSSQEALPDIVLVDLEMPHMDGIQTIAIASTLYPEMKFIVLTIFDNNQKIFEAIKAGANGYLLKDDDAIMISDAIFNVMSHNTVPMSPAIARKTLILLKTGFNGTNVHSVSSQLSQRENDVLLQLVEGLDYKQIASKLFISPATVRTHITNIYQKLHVTSKAQAIKMAYKNNWL
jgi:DNA-binding NarL/FixJ family response regulator